MALVAFSGLVGALPLALYLLPELDDVDVLGIPLSIALIGLPPFALFVTIGWVHEHRADALDSAFRDLADRE